jgi:hypothetical protein
MEAEETQLPFCCPENLQFIGNRKIAAKDNVRLGAL